MNKGWVSRAGLALIVATLALPLRADSRIEKTFTVAPGARFAVKTDNGSITVTGVQGNGVHVVITSRRGDLDSRYETKFEASANSVSIRMKQVSHHWFHFDWGDDIHFEVEVPAQTPVDLETSGGAITLSGTDGPAKLDTSGGSLHIHDYRGELHAETSGGGIDMAGITGNSRVSTSGGGIRARDIHGALSCDTSGGPIHVDNVSGDLSADTSGGPIRISGAGGKVDADTSGGGVTVSFLPGNARGGSLSSSGGGIEVSIDPKVGLNIDARGDSVETDLPLQVVGRIGRTHLRGTLNGGGALLTIDTSGGSVHLRPI